MIGKPFTEEDVDQFMASAHDAVLAALRNGQELVLFTEFGTRDTTKPGDQFESREFDGSRTITIRIMPGRG